MRSHEILHRADRRLGRYAYQTPDNLELADRRRLFLDAIGRLPDIPDDLRHHMGGFSLGCGIILQKLLTSDPIKSINSDMTDYLRSIFRLAEAHYSDYSDEEEAEQARLDDISSQKFQREKQFEQSLRAKLETMGLNVLDETYAINYDEAERELTIKIDDELNLRQIQALARLGDLKISAYGGSYLTVTIRTHEGLAIR